MDVGLREHVKWRNFIELPECPITIDFRRVRRFFRATVTDLYVYVNVGVLAYRGIGALKDGAAGFARGHFNRFSESSTLWIPVLVTEMTQPEETIFNFDKYYFGK